MISSAACILVTDYSYLNGLKGIFTQRRRRIRVANVIKREHVELGSIMMISSHNV